LKATIWRDIYILKEYIRDFHLHFLTEFWVVKTHQLVLSKLLNRHEGEKEKIHIEKRSNKHQMHSRKTVMRFLFKGNVYEVAEPALRLCQCSSLTIL